MKQDYLSLAKTYTELTKCFWCHSEIGEAMFRPDRKISGKYAFHVFSVHGLPPETLSDFANEKLTEAYFK